MKYSDFDYQHLQEVVTLSILLYKFMSCYSQLQKKRWTDYRHRTKSHGCRCHPGLEHTDKQKHQLSAQFMFTEINLW